jgi:hypothetical protein
MSDTLHYVNCTNNNSVNIQNTIKNNRGHISGSLELLLSCKSGSSAHIYIIITIVSIVICSASFFLIATDVI